MNALPVVDVASLSRSDADFGRIAADLDGACAEFGFFYVTGHGIDPSFDAVLEPITVARERSVPRVGSVARRWDGTDLATLSGTYGDYLLGKVTKVFPDLGRRHLVKS
jgi:hypothetical protein